MLLQPSQLHEVLFSFKENPRQVFHLSFSSFFALKDVNLWSTSKIEPDLENADGTGSSRKQKSL